jgi:eukaryotic-like serine/threonine-protein kinase
MGKGREDRDADVTAGGRRPAPGGGITDLNLTPAMLIDGTYRILGPLGQGGMGMVLLARDVRLERDVAVKVIRGDYLAASDSRERFLREARAMARVRHENVVAIHAFGEIEGLPYFVMEYVPGGTVETLLRKHRTTPLAIDEALGILDQLCRGVQAIHASGTAHRDIKASNVLLGPSFRVAVADLGLSRALGQGAEDGTASGTPAYMAPEVARGGELAPQLAARADVYSLGVLAYEMLTGSLPFEAPTILELIDKHLYEAPRPPSDLRGELPAPFDDAILAAMEKEPEQRVAGAEAFRRSLLEAREAVSTRPPACYLLVADDDPDFRKLATEVLRFAFPAADIESVADGTAALAALDRRRASLAVIDLDMPGLNGIELTAAIRGSENAKDVPIVVATATGGAPDWKLLSALGADGFLVKPIDPMALVTLARRFVAS